MKSMEQMQDEMLAKCRFDGSFPKPVIMGLGCLALANNQEEYDRLCAEADRLNTFMAWSMAVIGAGTLIGLLYVAILVP